MFASGGPSTTNPDDITILDGVIYVAYQNNAKADGTPTGATSTVVAYGRDGTQLQSWSLLGRNDGLTADPRHDRLIATVNEDANSSLYTIRPEAQADDQLRHYSYSPDPASVTGGGTDAISVLHGRIFISASNPQSGTAPAVFTARIPEHGSVASLSPTFYDNSQATDAVTGNAAPLALTDPDSNATVPRTSPRFGGDFVLDSQGDSQLVFVHHPGTDDQSLTGLALKSSAGAPQVDDVTWTKDAGGTLLVVDQGNDQIDAISGPFASGTALTSIPSGSPLAGDVGTIDLATGTVTPFATGFGSPKGLLYLAPQAEESSGGHHHHHDHHE